MSGKFFFKIDHITCLVVFWCLSVNSPELFFGLFRVRARVRGRVRIRVRAMVRIRIRVRVNSVTETNMMTHFFATRMWTPDLFAVAELLIMPPPLRYGGTKR